MSEKNLLLSSSGLKNIVLYPSQEDEFQFIFPQGTINTKTIFAEFISPKVSNLHQTDPTIGSISFNNQLNGDKITSDVLSKFKSLMLGESININEEESFQMKIISILLNNEELFNKISELYSNEISETNIYQYLSNLTFLYEISPTFYHFSTQDIINFVASHFYSIDKSRIIHLPKEVLLSIISNENIKIDNEDSLFEFIKQIFNEEDINESDISILTFYEQLDFRSLSEEKFREFIQIFNPSEITNELWEKLCYCFYVNTQDESQNARGNDRYMMVFKKFIYEGNPFEGIIDHLTKSSGGNVSENGTVKVTSSSLNNGSVQNVVDLHNTSSYIQFTNVLNSWIKFDFGDRKVHPTQYSIRTRINSNNHHLKNWVIEGSNTDEENDWKLLDSRQNDSFLNGAKVTHTYNISEQLDQRESFRYLRLRQTGVDANNYYFGTFSALEFFGFLK